MEPLFKIEIEQNRKMWYEDYYHALQIKWLKIFHLVLACYSGLYIIFIIYSWIKEGQIVFTWSDIVAVTGFAYASNYDYVLASLFSLILQRRIRKHTGLPCIPTCKLFYEEYMEWSNPRGRGTVSYDEITEMYNTKNMFILVNPKDKCRYFVSKNGFVVGTPHDFEQFITSKIAR